MLHRGQQLSATTARNVLAITEWRLSARSAGSDDVLDDSQPSDRADQAATSRDGMSQLCMSLEGPPSWHVHHGNAHRLDTTCKCESPTTSLDICLASSRPLHTPLPPLPLPRTPCTHSLVPHVQITASRRFLGPDKTLPIVSFVVLSGVGECEGSS